jgi:protein TonB
MMFNNLIESSSHAREFKRRGSFVLFTSAIYVTFFVIAGVASIYAYDARLDDQNTEIVTMLNPVDLPAAPVVTTHNTPPASGNSRPSSDVVRQIAIANVNQPGMVPDRTSATPNTNLPVPQTGRYTIGDHDSGPIGPGGSNQPGGSGTGPGTGGGPPAVDVGTPPPPAPTAIPRRIITSSRVLNGLAISLPKPAYPPIAKQARIQGSVNVQVQVDETGRVISAKAVSGSPMLMPAAQQAALAARFSPTMLGDQAVKVSGVIVYNFMLQ